MIIKIEQNSNGSYNNQNTVIKNIPDGWAVVPDDIVIPDTFPFVNIKTQEINGVMTVTEMTAGVVPAPEPTPEPEPTATDDLEQMAIDHEYRLTLLELGL